MNSLGGSAQRGALRRGRNRWIRFGLGMVVLLTSAKIAVAASQVVTVCGRDDAPGGLNLATALAVGGEIVIRCPAGEQAIAFTRTLDASGIVHLDGEGKVTLRGPVAGPLFTASVSLSLSGLTVENQRTAATATVAGAGTIIFGPKAFIELNNVTTQDSLAAYVAKSFTARNSTFLRNGDAVADEAASAVVNADMISLTHTAFTGNFEYPIAGGSTPEPGRPALSRSISIVDSVFTGNRSTLLLIDARVSIRRTRFEANGTPPSRSREAWVCCGGAITLVRSDADLSDTNFRGNGTSGFGGAIYAVGSNLHIARSVFDGNQARAGGAIMFWGRRPKDNIWSTGDWLDPLKLYLSRTRFSSNTATAFGGALAFAGAVVGDTVLFQSNVSGSAGGAIAEWHAEDLPEPYGEVIAGLVASTLLAPDSIALARPILVDNAAGTRGGAIAGGSAAVAVGNGLIARNRLTAAPGGGSVSGTTVALVNTTIADNQAGGLVVSSGTTAQLGNTILLRNSGFNCSLAGTVSSIGPNFQFPGSDCSTLAGRSDPGLDGQYAPDLISAARGAGNTGLCIADPQVGGVDLFGRPRLEGGRCDIGAIEQPRPPTIAAALGLGSGQNAVSRLLWLLVVLVILMSLLGLLWAVRRRRRHSRQDGKRSK